MYVYMHVLLILKQCMKAVQGDQSEDHKIVIYVIIIVKWSLCRGARLSDILL